MNQLPDLTTTLADHQARLDVAAEHRMVRAVSGPRRRIRIGRSATPRRPEATVLCPPTSAVAGG